MATFTRASKATYINKQGVMAEAGIDEPRFEKEGILIEGGSTNLVSNSILKDLNGWHGSGWVLTSENHAAPDGSHDATKVMPKFRENQVSYDRRISHAETGTNAFSVFAKAGEFQWVGITRYDGSEYYVASAWDLVDGRLLLSAPNSTSSSTYLGGGWWRLSVTATTTATLPHFEMSVRVYDKEPKDASAFPDGAADGTKGAYFWGAQVEKLPFASSYIPTNGTAVTRAADKVDIDGLKQTSSDNTLYAVISPIGAKSKYADIVSSLMPDYRIEYFGPESGQLAAYRGTIQASVGSKITGDYSLQDAWPVAVVSKGESFSTYANGSFVDSSTGSIPLSAGGNVTLGREGLAFFHIRDLRVWNHALTAEQIATL